MKYPIYIGSMNVIGKRDSFDFHNNKDIFNAKSSNYTKDHIWPASRNGSKAQQNLQTLTKFANFEKGNKVSGCVNDVRFTILQDTIDENDKIIGTMYVSYDQGISWYVVNKV